MHSEQPLERPDDEVAYAYLLGMYLGDGWVGRIARSWTLKVTLDASYAGIVRECVAAMAAVAPRRVTALLRSEGSTVVLGSCGSGWPCLFPQHGPGKKHERKIELLDWQCSITRQYTPEFIRGLIHSDGSRCINRFSMKLPSGRVGRYAYPRNISVSHRDSVALLDSFVGPKT